MRYILKLALGDALGLPERDDSYEDEPSNAIPHAGGVGSSSLFRCVQPDRTAERPLRQ
jgi:hypothetical protein